MADTLFVKPRTGLILPGIPRSGAAIPRELAEEWIENRMVVAVIEPIAVSKKQPAKRSPKGSGATRPRKQRRTR